MKTTFKRAIFAIAMMLITASTSWAYDFIVDGIYYNYNGDGETVSVTYKNKDYDSYSGSVVIPSTVTYDGTTYSVTSIGEAAFQNCIEMTSLTISNSITSISRYTFYNCEKLTSAIIPESVTEVGESAFQNCLKMTSLTIGESVTSINQYAFSGCYTLSSVNIPESVTEIGDGAFETCSNLTSLTIGNSVTSIGSYAFNNCKNLISVTIPKSVNKIGDKAFYNCYGILSFTSLNTTPPSAPSENVFKGIPRSDCTLFVPEESITSYSGSMGWSYFYNIQGIKNDHVETVEHNVVKVATADGAISISGADGAIAEIFFDQRHIALSWL